MKSILLLVSVLAVIAPAAAAPVPHLEKNGAVTQLMVDGRPWLILGGEVANTASSSLPYMETVWPRLTQLNLNTVLVAAAWAWVEPEEGKFDFALVDGLLAGARAHHLHLVFIWFGSWKNGLSSFAPAWVKRDPVRFPRVQLADGQSIEILTPLSDTALAADTRAYVKFLEHLAQADTERTVLMIQLQNEVGVLGASRDRSAAADAAFAGPVPAALLDSLNRNREHLAPALRQLWNNSEFKLPPSWAQAFGSGPAADEIFMAWHYARYMGSMAAAGKAAYPLPVFTNSWIVQPEDKGPGDYPSGGPQPLTLDVWKAGAPAIDLNCPDIYLPNFNDHVAAFHRADNPLFVPESRGDAAGVANAFFAIGAHASLGYSPFGIDNPGRLLTLRPEPGTPPPTELATLPLARAYALLRELSPLILEHQARGTIGAAWLSRDQPRQEVVLGGHALAFELRRNRRSGAISADTGSALVFALGPDEFLLAGTDVQVTFQPRSPGDPIDGIADAEAGVWANGKWVAGRKMSGDDILLDYHLAAAAAANQSGSGLQFGPDGPTLQRVTLYRYH